MKGFFEGFGIVAFCSTGVMLVIIFIIWATSYNLDRDSWDCVKWKNTNIKSECIAYERKTP